MKYSKFIQDVRDLGYSITNTETVLYIASQYANGLIAIDKTKMCNVDSTYDHFNTVPTEDKVKLFNLATELAGTPIEDRKNEERYRLRLPFVLESRSYLNLCDDGSYFISGKYDWVEARTVFSESEIITLKEKHNLDGFVMEGVLENE